MKGQPLGAAALPHKEFWLEFAELVRDGAMWSKAEVMRRAGGKSDEGLSAGLREGKATGGDEKTSGGESEEPAPAAATEAAARPESAGNDKGESSDDSDGLVE